MATCNGRNSFLHPVACNAHYNRETDIIKSGLILALRNQRFMRDVEIDVSTHSDDREFIVTISNMELARGPLAGYAYLDKEARDEKLQSVFSTCFETYVWNAVKGIDYDGPGGMVTAVIVGKAFACSQATTTKRTRSAYKPTKRKYFLYQFMPVLSYEKAQERSRKFHFKIIRDK